jgi:hypothetical protein
MKQTAVQWLKDELEEYGSPVELTLDWETFDKLFKQAKEMEKQQIIDASNNSYLNSDLIRRSSQNKKINSLGEQYYNEKYNTK